MVPAPRAFGKDSGRSSLLAYGRPEQPAHTRRYRHRQRSPEGYTEQRGADRRTPGARAQNAEQCQANQRHPAHCDNEGRHRCNRNDKKRGRGAGTECESRCQGRLKRTCARDFGHSKFVAGMGRKRVFRHHLIGHGRRRTPIDPACFVNPYELLSLNVWMLRQLPGLASQIGLLGIVLRAD